MTVPSRTAERSRRRPSFRPVLAKNGSEVAEFLGCSMSTIAYMRRSGAPCGGNGPYDLGAIVRWVEERRKKRFKLVEESRAASVAADPDHAYKVARARLLEFRFEQARAALIPARDHRLFVARLTSTFAAGLRSCARPLSKALEGLDERERLDVAEDHFTDLLAGFADPASASNGQHAAEGAEETE